MSVAGILGSSLFSAGIQSLFQSKKHQFSQGFQQLGQDLQSGNLSAAQSDLTTLQQMKPANSISSSQDATPLSQDFTQLSQDLQSGDLSAAQQDYAKIQQDFQSQSTQMQHHHHHHGGGDSSELNQLMAQLGQSLQAGNLSAAQQAYGSLQQDLQLFGQTLSTQASSSSNSVSLSA